MIFFFRLIHVSIKYEKVVSSFIKKAFAWTENISWERKIRINIFLNEIAFLCSAEIYLKIVRTDESLHQTA